MRSSYYNSVHSEKRKTDNLYDIFKELDRVDHSFISKITKSVSNSEMVPSEATLRLEYVKCGKPNCYRVFHGPYYYAYWRDKENKGILKKKYIGYFDPRSPYVRQLGTHHGSDKLKN